MQFSHRCLRSPFLGLTRRVILCNIQTAYLAQQATPAISAVTFASTRGLASEALSKTDDGKVVAAPSMDRVWELWSEGNLFALPIAELQAFLREQKVPVDLTWKKTTLVKQVEELVGKQKNTGRNVKDITPVSGLAKTAEGPGGALNPADVYGELAGDGILESQTFVDVQQSGLYTGADAMGPIIPRAFQLMHESICPDVLLSRINTSAFPGGNATLQAFTLIQAKAASANKARFNKAFQWCVMNLWNMNMDGEAHVSLGRLLLWKGAQGKQVQAPLPGGADEYQTLWTLQQQLQAAQPYSWLGIAHGDCGKHVAEFLSQNGWTETQNGETTTTYRVSVQRQKEVLEGEVGVDGKTISLQKSWERFLLTFYVRDAMPDVRIQLRARMPLKKKTAEMFQNVNLINVLPGGEKVSSALPGDLGEVVYVLRQETKSWEKKLNSGILLTLSETTTNVAFTKKDTREKRLEYELSTKLPTQDSKPDLTALSDELWEAVLSFASAVQPGMQAFRCSPKS